MVNLGIVGLGNHWESRYKPAIDKLSNRLAVKAIYTPVMSRAKQVSEDFNAYAVEGINLLANIPNIRGILLLETGWAKIEVLKLLLHLNKPVFLAESINLDLQQLIKIHHEAQDIGLSIMPELSRRYMPATARLQELMATQLGRPKIIRIKSPIPCPEKPQNLTTNAILHGIFDWCYYIGRSKSKEIHVQHHQNSPCPGLTRSEIKIQYEKSKLMHPPAILELKLNCLKHEYGNSTSAKKDHFLCEIICENGTARIESPIDIQWEINSKEYRESLESDHSDIEVMLDHFCRRAIGGLIPVPNLEDYCRSAKLMKQIFSVE